MTEPITLQEFKLQTLQAIEYIYDTTACHECKEERCSNPPGIFNFYNFLRYVLDKKISCCDYACQFIQRMIQFPLYSTIWFQHTCLPYLSHIEQVIQEVPVDVLFITEPSFHSLTLIRVRDIGLIHTVPYGHLDPNVHYAKK